MKSTIQKLLVAALLISMISPVIAAQPQKTEIKTKDEQRGKLQDTKNASLKNKIVTALGVAAALVVAYAFYKYKTRPDADLERLHKFDRDNAPQEQVSGGHPGRLWFYSSYQSPHFQAAMRNLRNAQNLNALFADQRFIDLVNHPRADLVREVLRQAFNDPNIVQASAQDNFIPLMIQRTEEIINGLVTP